MRNDFKMIVLCKDGVKRRAFCIQHGMQNRGRISWEKKKSSVSINAEKTNNAPNNVERFKMNSIDKKICVVHILGGIIVR
jgi:hypothetical protein